jgi:uncharacterized repeat protein (TIGR01451 family)/fimbrial isopeptide formation D2 family protein
MQFRFLYVLILATLTVSASFAVAESQQVRRAVPLQSRPAQAAAHRAVDPACDSNVILPVAAAGGSLVWRACDGSFLARFDYGTSAGRGVAFSQTSSSATMPPTAALAGGLPVPAGSAPLVYFDLVGLSPNASVSYATPRVDRSLLVSPSIVRGGTYELVRYERAATSAAHVQTGFRIAYQSAAYTANAPRLLSVASPLAGLTLPRGAHAYVALLAVTPATAPAITSTCRGQLGSAYDPNTGSFNTAGSAVTVRLPCFRDFTSNVIFPATTSSLSLALASSTNNALGSTAPALCGTPLPAACGTPLFYSKIVPSAAATFAPGTKLIWAVDSPSAIAQGNNYAASVYDLITGKTIESVDFIRSSAQKPTQVGTDHISLSSLPRAGAVLVLYRQPPFPALSVTETDNAGSTGWTVGQGGAQYTLTVANDGPAPTAGSFTLSDTLPSFVILRAAPSAASPWNCSGSPGARTLTCTYSGVLAAGKSAAPITVPVTLPSGTTVGTKAITNYARVYGGGDPVHPTLSNAAFGTDSTTILAPALTLTKTDNSGTTGWTIGQSNARYTLTIANAGTAATTGTTTVTDTLPAGLTLSAGPNSTGAWTCTGNAGGQSLRCTSTTSIAAGSAAPAINVPVTIGSKTAVGSSAISNMALVFGGGDPAHGSAGVAVKATRSTSINGIPSLTIAKSDNGGAAGWTIGQSNAQYTLTVGNASNATAATTGTITVIDTLPAGLTVNGSGTLGGTNWNCSISGRTLQSSAKANADVHPHPAPLSATVTCTNSTDGIAAGATDPNTIAIPVTIGSTTATGTNSISNTATVSGGGDPAHTSTSPASSNPDTTTVKKPPALSLSVSDDGPFGVDLNPADQQTPALAHGARSSAKRPAASSHAPKVRRPRAQPTGGVPQYTITVGNTGANPTNGQITVTFTLPAGVTANGAPGASDNSWSCANTVATTYVCTAGASIGAGTSASAILVPIKIGPSVQPGALAFSASVYGGSDPTYGTSGNQLSANDSAQVNGPIIVFLTDTSASSWTVPSDFNPNNNLIEAIGGGGGGGAEAGGGGGGGAYAATSDAALVPGSNVTIAVGTAGLYTGNVGGSGGDSYLCSSSTCDPVSNNGVVVRAGGGAGGQSTPGGNGGNVVVGTGYSGGPGGYFNGCCGGGGGGAAGRFGAGVAGNGGNSDNINGGAGDAGAGGAGGLGSESDSGSAGGSGAEFDATHGSGGGGGGAGGDSGSGGVGGAYGGGAGGDGGGSGGIGGYGIIVVTYTSTTKSTNAATPSLTVSKTDNSGNSGWTVGQPGAQYTIAVGNANAATAATYGAITVTDTLPAGLTLGATPSGAGWSCTTSTVALPARASGARRRPAFANGSNAFTCVTRTTIVPGSSSAPLEVPVVIGASTPTGTGAITNTASAYGGGDPAHTSASPATSNADQTTIVPLVPPTPG